MIQFEKEWCVRMGVCGQCMCERGWMQHTWHHCMFYGSWFRKMVQNAIIFLWCGIFSIYERNLFSPRKHVAP